MTVRYAAAFPSMRINSVDPGFTATDFNSSLDPAGDAIFRKSYYHIGFAADTPNGLVVPVVKDADKRWRITFPFGLVHGFGFAGALGEIALPRPEIPLALFSFNLGVEAGQLAALAVVLPIILVARKKKWFAEHGVKIASAGIIALGLVWFVLRVAG